MVFPRLKSQVDIGDSSKSTLLGENFRNGTKKVYTRGVQLFDFDEKIVLEVVEEDEMLTILMLAKDFNVDCSTIVCRRRNVGKVWR